MNVEVSKENVKPLNATKEGTEIPSFLKREEQKLAEVKDGKLTVVTVEKK